MLLIPIAFLSGILTALSPCVIPILPIILASGIDGSKKRINGIMIGLVVSFTLVSMFLAAIVSALGISADAIRTLAVVLLVVFGLSMVFPSVLEKFQAWMETKWRVQPSQNREPTLWGGFVTGISLGIVWTPCIGPIVATVATLAAINSFSPISFVILLSFALGAALPLYFIARGGAKAAGRLTIFKTQNQQIRRVFGYIILATALAIWSGADRAIQTWTLNNLPEEWVNVATTFEDRFDIESELDNLRGEENMQLSGNTIVRNVNLQNDFDGAKISKDELIQGCFGKDCIPSIDDPVFETASEASWLLDSDRVFTLEYKGETRAYPQRILNWHEIVNDVVKGDPISITFCPLCGSALAFERKVDGVITEFGVSGKLHNNDLIMYDRYEGNLWQQITGEGIVGPAARRDEVLTKVPLFATTWGEWKSEHPDTKVLSRDTGHSRDYDRYPYGTYEQDDRLVFGMKDLDQSLQIKTPVYGVEIDGNSRAYPVDVFDQTPEITDTLGTIDLQLSRTEDGDVIITRLDTNEQVTPIRLFWFAWAAFHPNTDIYSD